MVKHRQLLLWSTTACAFLSLGLGAASAQVYVSPTYVAPAYGADSSQDLGFYITSELGPSFMPDFQSSRFGFPGQFSARPGVRFGAEPGFNFLATGKLTLGAEFETGVIYNYLNSVRNAGAPTPLRGDYYQVPLLGSLVLKFHPDSFVIPYVGVGAGGDYSDARIHTPGFFGSGTWDSQIDPAVQAMAGIRFRLNSVSDVGFGYKFLAAFPNSGTYIGTHAALATFTVRF
jgi:opacity protein-like surface antigen